MTGKELLSLVAIMVYGRSRTAFEERLLNLQYLNLANLDIWSCMLGAKDKYKKHTCNLTEQVSRNFVNYQKEGEGYFSIDPKIDDLCTIKGIYNKFNQIVTSAGVEDIFTFGDFEYTCLDGNYYFKDIPANKLLTYVYTIIPPKIKDTETSINHIPSIFQHALVSGALYYATVSTFGFADKIQIQLGVWEEMKRKITYLTNTTILK